MSTRRELANAAQCAGLRTVPSGVKARGAACGPAAQRGSRRCAGPKDCIKYQACLESPAAERAGRAARGACVSARVGIRPSRHVLPRTSANRPENLRGAEPARTARQGATAHQGGTTTRSEVSMRPGGLLEQPNEACRRLAVGAGATLSWRRAVGTDGRRIGRDELGASDLSPERRAHSEFTAGRTGREGGERLETAN